MIISMYQQERDVLTGLTTRTVDGDITTYTPLNAAAQDRRTQSYNNRTGKPVPKPIMSKDRRLGMNHTEGFHD